MLIWRNFLSGVCSPIRGGGGGVGGPWDILLLLRRPQKKTYRPFIWPSYINVLRYVLILARWVSFLDVVRGYSRRFSPSSPLYGGKSQKVWRLQ